MEQREILYHLKEIPQARWMPQLGFAMQLLFHLSAQQAEPQRVGCPHEDGQLLGLEHLPANPTQNDAITFINITQNASCIGEQLSQQ